MESSWDNERVTLGRSFLRDMESLWADILKLAAVVEGDLNQSIHAFCNGRAELAEELQHQKRAMDRWEVQIERECVRVLAFISQLLLIFDVSQQYSRLTATSNGFAT